MEKKFVNPSTMYLLAKEEDRSYFRSYPVLNRRLGPVAGTLLCYLLNEQWKIESNPQTKRRFPNCFRSVRELSEILGFSQKKIKESLNLLRDNELVWTKRKGWPAKNNFFFDQDRIMEIVLSSPHQLKTPLD